MTMPHTGRALRRCIVAGAISVVSPAQADMHLINRTDQLLICSLDGMFETLDHVVEPIRMVNAVSMIPGQVAPGRLMALWWDQRGPEPAFVGAEVSCFWLQRGAVPDDDRWFILHKALSRDRGFFTIGPGLQSGIPTIQRDLTLVILRVDDGDDGDLPGFALAGAVQVQRVQGLGRWPLAMQRWDDVPYREIRRMAVRPMP